MRFLMKFYAEIINVKIFALLNISASVKLPDRERENDGIWSWHRFHSFLKTRKKHTYLLPNDERTVGILNEFRESSLQSIQKPHQYLRFLVEICNFLLKSWMHSHCSCCFVFLIVIHFFIELCEFFWLPLNKLICIERCLFFTKTYLKLVPLFLIHTKSF